MIGLVDFLLTAGIPVDVKSTKIHLACWNGREHPINVFYDGKFKEWQEHQRQRNFKCTHVLSLIDLGNRHWLFVGVYDVLGVMPHPTSPGCFLYKTEPLANQDDLIGRVIVYHERTRASYVWHEPKDQNKPKVNPPIVEIRRERMSIADFPGYNSVVISHAELSTITRQKIESWYGALANIKGVYLITDTTSGKHYVGKASGEVGIWQRWCAYAKNGHGGNVELKKLLKEEGNDHMNQFQYSILEIADSHASDEDILARESYWMHALKTREFGLN